MSDLTNYAPRYRYVVSYDEDSRPWAEWANLPEHVEGMDEDERAAWLDPEAWASYLVVQERADVRGGAWETVEAVGGFDFHDDGPPEGEPIPGVYVLDQLPPMMREHFTEDGPPVPSGLIDPGPYGVDPTYGTDSAATVEAAPADVWTLVHAFLWGTCDQRAGAYSDLRRFVLPGLSDALDVLQDCHDDGCPCADGEEVPGEDVEALPWFVQTGSHGRPILRATPGADYVPTVDVVGGGLDVVNVLWALDHDGPEVEVTLTEAQARLLWLRLGAALQTDVGAWPWSEEGTP